MKKIGFVGVYDKSYLILSIARVLTLVGKKVLVLDATINQKCKYVVPVINPTKAYVTEFEGIDVGVGFDNIEGVKQYLGLQEDENMEYDILLTDVDNSENIEKFNIPAYDKLYFLTSFDVYSIKKGIEVLSQLKVPLKMSKIFYSKEMLNEEEEYFAYLALGLRVEWDDNKLYFWLENGDQPAIYENQRLATIKLKNLSVDFRDNVNFIVNEIDKEIGDKEVKNAIKKL